jgi:hypothetical protein
MARHLLKHIGMMAGAGMLGVAFATSGTPALAEEDEFGGSPRAPGVEITYYACSACHSFKLVAQQGLSKESWREVLVWMVEEQEMEPMEPSDFLVTLNYLTKFYGPDRLANKLAAKR